MLTDNDNIITKGDIKKFLVLLQAGLLHGYKKELKNYSAKAIETGGYYVSLEFRFHVNKPIIEDLLAEDAIDDELKEMLSKLNNK